MSKLDRVTFTVDDQEVPADDFVGNSLAHGGYDRMQATLSLAKSRRLSSAIDQGAPLRAYARDSIFWEGRINAAPLKRGGRAIVNASGHKERVEKTAGLIWWQYRGYDLWQAGYDEPFFIVDISDVNVAASLEEARMQFILEKDLTYGLPGGYAFNLWLRGKGGPRRIAFDIQKSSNRGQQDVEVWRGTDQVSIQEGVFGCGSGGPSSVDLVIGGNPNLIQVALRCNLLYTPATRWRLAIKNLRVNSGLMAGPPWDTYPTSSVLTNLAAQVGFDATGIKVSTQNALPLFWLDSWLELIDYVTMLEDRKYRVLEDRGSGPYFEVNDWTDGDVWTAALSRNAVEQLQEAEIYNEVKVGWDYTSGIPGEVTLKANPDPLASRSITNTYYEEIEDPLVDDALPNAIATKLLSVVSAPAWTGRVTLTDAHSPTRGASVYQHKGGDFLYLEDFEGGQQMRVLDVEYTPNRIVCGIEGAATNDPTLEVRRLRRERRLLRIRRPRRKRGRRR